MASSKSAIGLDSVTYSRSNSVSFGNAFNAADILGVPLFGAEDRMEFARLRREGRERLALLPTRVHRPGRRSEPDDDF